MSIIYDMNTDIDETFSLDELCTLVDLPKRTVRFYIQKELVDRPIGLKKGARYHKAHLEQLLSIKKWQAAGLSLERIAELLQEPDPADIPPRPRQSGTVEVWSHLYIDDGLELHIEPTRAGLSPEMVRSLTRLVLDGYRALTEEKETR